MWPVCRGEGGREAQGETERRRRGVLEGGGPGEETPERPRARFCRPGCASVSGSGSRLCGLPGLVGFLCEHEESSDQQVREPCTLSCTQHRCVPNKHASVRVKSWHEGKTGRQDQRRQRRRQRGADGKRRDMRGRGRRGRLNTER